LRAMRTFLPYSEIKIISLFGLVSMHPDIMACNVASAKGFSTALDWTNVSSSHSFIASSLFLSFKTFFNFCFEGQRLLFRLWLGFGSKLSHIWSIVEGQ